MTSEVIALSTNESVLGNTIIITSSGGEDVSSISLAWSCNGKTGTANLGNFTFDEATFEPLSINSDFINVIFTLTSTFSDGTTASTQATCKVSVPNKYDPTIYVSSVSCNSYVNSHVRASDTAKATFLFQVNKIGSATYTISVSDVVCSAPTSYTLNSDNVVFTLPVISAESYTLSFKLTITDSRGRTYTTTVNSSLLGTVYCYDAPLIKITAQVRCDESGVTKVNGLYALISGEIIDSSSVYSLKVNGASVTPSGNTFVAIVGNGRLDLGKKYQIPVEYKSVLMNNNGYSPIVVYAEIEAQRVPVSFLDNGSMVGISIGEMAQPYDDVSSDIMANFGIDCIMRGANGKGNIALEEAYNVIMARKYITEQILGGLKFVALSESEYNAIKNKDGNTVYIVY